GAYTFPFVKADQFTYGTLDFSQFSAVLEYLKSRANTEVISNPRITTLNNKEAKIFVGSIYNYISKMEVDTETKERTYDYKEKEIGIRLLVTPNVNADGEIIIKLKPEIKDVVGYQQLTSDFQLPIFSTREAETEVMIKDRDTIFIGGLIKENKIKQERKFPVVGDMLGDVPFIGNMVRWKSDETKRTELIFFITVHVVGDVNLLTNAVNQTRISKQELKDFLIDYTTAMARKAGGQDVGDVEKKPFFDFRKKAERPARK
ncbi:MAG: type II and III secretion system protein, partial [Candidatus Omnitrophica bacterium]|nr:type II and III secretion system protein [Candidatus Omnitrophota bacterium]